MSETKTRSSLVRAPAALQGPLAVPLSLLTVALALVPPTPGWLPSLGNWSDLVISHWPSALVIQRGLAAGSLPLWNPYYAGGRPLAADPLAALYYPPTQLLRFLSIGDYFYVTILVHLLLAGAGAYLIARVLLRLSRGPSLVAGIAYMGAPRLIGHLGAGHLTMTQAAAWLPWVAFGCCLTVRSPARWGLPFAASLAMLLLAGHPQLTYYGAMMLVALATWQTVGRWRKLGLGAALRSVAALAAAGVVALLLASAHLVPMLEFTAFSTRRLSVATTDAATLWQLLGALVGIRIPSPVPHETLLEPGMVVLLLALVGAVAAWRRARPLLLGAAVVLALAMGTTSPVYALAARLLPSLDQFRGVARVWYLGALALALVAALGLDALGRRSSGPLARRSRTLTVLGVLLVAANVVLLGHPLLNVGGVAAAITPSSLERFVVEAAGTSRVYGLQRNFTQLGSVSLGVDLAHGQDPLLVEPYASFMQRAGGYAAPGYQLAVPSFDADRDARPDPRLLGLLDVGVVLSDAPLDDPRLSQIAVVDGTYVYRNAERAGRAYLVEAEPNGAPPTFDDLRRLDGAVTELEGSAERLSFDFEASSAGFLVVAEPVYPGWLAILDGRPMAMESVEGVLPAVRVDAGRHQLVYEYAPRSVTIGRALSGAGLVLGLAWAGIGLASRRRAARKGK